MYIDLYTKYYKIEKYKDTYSKLAVGNISLMCGKLNSDL